MIPLTVVKVDLIKNNIIGSVRLILDVKSRGAVRVDLEIDAGERAVIVTDDNTAALACGHRLREVHCRLEGLDRGLDDLCKLVCFAREGHAGGLLVLLSAGIVPKSSVVGKIVFIGGSIGKTACVGRLQIIAREQIGISRVNLGHIRLDLVRGAHICKYRHRGKQSVLEISLVAGAEVSADAEHARLRHINVGVSSRYSLLELAVDIAVCVFRVKGDSYVGKLTSSEIYLIEGDTLIGTLSAVSEPEEGIAVSSDLKAVAMGRAVLIVSHYNAKLACGSILVNGYPSLKGMGML